MPNWGMMGVRGDEVEPSTTALAVFQERVAMSGARVAMRRKRAGTWRAVSWSALDNTAAEIAAGLIDCGVNRGDRVVILAKTRSEWLECDLGILKAGAATVPIYPSNTPEQCEYIIKDARAKVVIAEDPHQLEKIIGPDGACCVAGVEVIVLMDKVARLDRPDSQGRIEVGFSEVVVDPSRVSGTLFTLPQLRESGQEWLAANRSQLTAMGAEITKDDLATIVYTSGTTGAPKGVVLTHGNLAFECIAVRDILGLGEQDEQLLFLPLAHIFAKVLAWASIAVGAPISFAESVSALIQNMQELKPTFVGAVPRVYEKAFAKIQAQLESKRQSPVSRVLIDWALTQGRGRSQTLEQPGLGIRLADKLVFAKIQQTFGGRLRFFISGGAPLSKEIGEFFFSAGVLILEGYGLTETTAATHVNRPHQVRFGTVGPPVPGVEVKLAPDGEVLVRGGNVMKEYYGRPEATAAAIDPSGWFHTGDIGVIEEGGFLRITDRKKDIIITAGGKNVAPQNIEGMFKAMCPYVSQIMVHGDKRKFLSALITLNAEALTPWAQQNGLESEEMAVLSGNPSVKSLIQGYVDDLNGKLASYETIKKFAILPEDLREESGELTPTLKVKRSFCEDRYRQILDGFYEPERTETEQSSVAS